MIGLIRVLPPPGSSAGTVPLNELPRPPAARLSAFIIRCDQPRELDTALSWFADIRAVRPALALGLVCPLELCAAPLGALRHPVNPVLSPAELHGGAVPSAALDELRSASVEGRVFEELVHEYGELILAERELVECVAAHAVRGETVRRVAKKLGISEETLRRRLRPLGIRPGRLMSSIRVRAFHIRLDLGSSRAAALKGGNWHTSAAKRKCEQRLKRLRTGNA